MSKVFAGVTVAAAFALVAFNLWGLHGPGVWAKMTASTGFICVAVSVGAHRWTYGRIMLAGLFLSWWGDWFLTRSGDTGFLLGLVSFLSAHVMYCIAFGVRGIRWQWSLAALPVVAAVTGGVLMWISPHVSADMIWPVRVYTTVISIMVILSVGAMGASEVVIFFVLPYSSADTWFVRAYGTVTTIMRTLSVGVKGPNGPLGIPIGAVLFYLSDISVATGQFHVTDFPNYIWGLPFYFIGQVCLAFSAARLTAAEAPGAAAVPARG